MWREYVILTLNYITFLLFLLYMEIERKSALKVAIHEERNQLVYMCIRVNAHNNCALSKDNIQGVNIAS